MTSVSHSAGVARVAASIEYEAAPPPNGLPDDMEPLPGASLRFLSIKAIDGFKVQAALWQQEAKLPAETTIIVQVHGSGGNLASLPLWVIARALSARGYAALSISTRQHDEHLNTDNFFDVRRDIEAAVVTAKVLGFRSVVLQGHSLGTVQVAFYAFCMPIRGAFCVPIDRAVSTWPCGRQSRRRRPWQLGVERGWRSASPPTI